MTTSGHVGCDRWVEAISALADGEEPGVDRHLLDAHVDRCSSCRTFRAHLQQMHGPLRIGPAPRMPDLSRRIVKLNAIADRARWRIVRALLAVVAVEIIASSVPALLFGREHGLPSHPARHLGAFSVAYGAALLVVVVRPSRARSVLPVALTLAGALVMTAVVDVVNGQVPLVGEVRHIPEIFSVVLVWLMAAPSFLREPRSDQLHPGGRLRVVEDRSDEPSRSTGPLRRERGQEG